MEAKAIPVWRWPNILSIDTPVIAVLWQHLFASSFGVRLEVHHALILGISVWLAYAADHWVDAWAITGGHEVSHRHFFYLKARRMVFGIWALLFAFAVWLSFERLSMEELRNGVLLLIATVGYSCLHPFMRSSRSWWIPKEMLVSLVFGAGVFLFIFPMVRVRYGDLVLLAALSIFITLLFGNCTLIARWEAALDDRLGFPSFVLRWPRASGLGRWTSGVVLVLATAGAAVAGPVNPSARFCPALALAAGGLMGLDLARGYIHREDLRVLGDCVLLTPLLWLLI